MMGIKYTDQENHNPGELTVPEYSQNRQQSVKPLDNRKWENFILSVDANKTFFDDHIEMSFNAYRRMNDIDFTSTYRSGTVEEFFTLSTQKGCVAQAAYNETLGDVDNQLVVGVEYSNAGDNNEKIVLTGGAGSDNSIDKDDTGFYAQDTLTLYEKLILQFGMRHDEVDFRFEDHTNAANNATSDFDETTFKTGIVVKPTDNIDVYANFSEAFKAPGSSELFNTTGWGGNDPNLKPEEARSYEIGTRLRMNDKLSTNVSLFRIDTDEEIQSIETAPWTYVNTNIGETRRYGIETSVKLRPWEYFDTYFTHTFVDATVRKTTTYVNSGRELGLVPRNRFTAGIHAGTYKGFDFWLNGLFVGPQNSQSAETADFEMDPIERYYVFNSKLSYRYKDMEIYLKVNNLLDRKYYTRGIYNFTGSTFYVTPAPEREILGGVSIAWGPEA